MCGILGVLATLFAAPIVEAGALEMVDGPNLRAIPHDDGSTTLVRRSDDLETLTVSIYSKEKVLIARARYRVKGGNPLGGNFEDGRGNPRFKIRFGYQPIGVLRIENVYSVPIQPGERAVLLRTYEHVDEQGRPINPVAVNFGDPKAFEGIGGSLKSFVEINSLFNEANPQPDR